MGNSSLSYLPNALVIEIPEIDLQHARLFEQLAVFKAGNLGAAGPMTYLHKGKQYIALATGNGPDSELVAYALP